MGVTVNLDKNLVNTAKAYCGAQNRSIPKQIEYWAKIGRIAEDNPDLSYEVIKGILQGLEDLKIGNLKEYRGLL